MRSEADVAAVLRLKGEGLTDREVSLATAVPIATIRTWRRRGAPRRLRKSGCGTCGAPEHDWDALPRDTYAYLLGVYLGDGYLIRWGRSWTLRVTLDSAYPEIVEECRSAVSSISGGSVAIRSDGDGKACVHVVSTWRSWPCAFPQHGAGRKHDREIVLSDWQQQIVDTAPGPFLRGLIHTDGWRGINRVEVKGRSYEYPRYQFSNRSDDIRRLFCEACDRLGVEWRPWTRFHISVARRDSVARLDRFVGPKR